MFQMRKVPREKDQRMELHLCDRSRCVIDCGLPSTNQSKLPQRPFPLKPNYPTHHDFHNAMGPSRSRCNPFSEYPCYQDISKHCQCPDQHLISSPPAPAHIPCHLSTLHHRSHSGSALPRTSSHYRSLARIFRISGGAGRRIAMTGYRINVPLLHPFPIILIQIRPLLSELRSTISGLDRSDASSVGVQLK